MTHKLFGAPGDPIPQGLDWDRIWAAFDALTPARWKNDDDSPPSGAREARNTLLADDPHPAAWPPHGRVVAHKELLDDRRVWLAPEDQLPWEDIYDPPDPLYRGTDRRPGVRVIERGLAEIRPNLQPIKDWATEHGRTPTVKEWNAHQKTRRVPSTSGYCHVYGSWSRTMVAAGLKPNPRGMPPKPIGGPATKGQRVAWTIAEDQLVMSDLTYDEIAERTGRTHAAIGSRRALLRKAEGATTDYRYWTEDEDSILWDGSAKEVAYVVGRSERAVYARRAQVRR